MNRQIFFQGDELITNKMAMLLIIRKVQIKTTVRGHFMFIMMPLFKQTIKTTQKTGLGKKWRNVRFMHSMWDYKLAQLLGEERASV